MTKRCSSGTKKPLYIAFILSLIILAVGVSLGSTGINICETFQVLGSRIFRLNIETDPLINIIVWELRLPRTILAFIVGGSLAISGAVFQSVLKNQLASPYLLGVSSGASLGAALVMIIRPLMLGSILGIGFVLFIQPFILPLVGFIVGLGTVFIVLALGYKLDKNLSNNTIILLGMVFSLFINALLTTLLSLYREELRNLLIWQLGSFSMRSWNHVLLMLPFLVFGLFGIIRYTGEMDILSFGEDQGRSMGVNSRAVRKRLFLFSAMLTGAGVALCGAIGFVDLIAPHISRRIIGSRHSYVIPLSFCIGGTLMVTADIIARTALSPSELPVGAVTALIGAPFFAWVYFGRHHD